MVIREVLHHHLVCAVMCVHSLVIAQTVFNLLSFYIASVVLFKLHVCVVSHMQVLATTLLSVHNIRVSCPSARLKQREEHWSIF